MPPLSSIAAIGVLAAAGAIGTCIDLRTRRIPNVLTGSLAAVGIAMAALHVSGLSVGSAALGLLAGLALMLPGHLIGATGAGDVKLFAAAGTLLGPAATVTAFVYTVLIGGVLALAAAVRRRRIAATLERTIALVRTAGANAADIESAAIDNRFAYGPAIAAGTICAALRILN